MNKDVSHLISQTLQQTSVAQQQVATKQSKAVMQRPSQSSTHNYPLNCLPMACTLNRSLLPITTSTISKGYCTFSGSDVDVDGFRVRAQGWTRWMKPKRTIAKLNCNGTLIFLNNTHTHRGKYCDCLAHFMSWFDLCIEQTCNDTQQYDMWYDIYRTFIHVLYVYHFSSVHEKSIMYTV